MFLLPSVRVAGFEPASLRLKGVTLPAELHPVIPNPRFELGASLVLSKRGLPVA
jgi:hypothetical protein